MSDLTTAMARAADTLSESLAQPCATGSQTRYGTVVANNGSTLDVAMAGGTVTGVLMTTACCSAVAGDRVLLDVTGPLVTATGILANSDNGPYVKPTVSTPFAGATLYRIDGVAVLQITNLTLSAGVIRTAGKLPVKPALKAVGTLSYNNAAGYVAVSTDGTTTCWSTASGDFSGQVFFAIQD